MSRQNGKDCQIYWGARDASGDLHNIAPTFTADTHDVTTFANSGFRSFSPGMAMWEADCDAFYDGAANGIGQQWESLLGAPGSIVSIYDGNGNAIGDNGLLLSDAVLSKRGQPITISDLIRLKGHIKAGTTSGAGKAGLYAVLLHVLASRSTTANGTGFDGGASSANGGRANLHATALTGSGGTVKIQHSTDNSTFADLITFVASTVIGAQTLEVTGTVNRYLRAQWTIPGASSLTFVAGFARY